ncbi:hypothetical protein SAMD00019534_061910 [Acytostelium subglobosum LB1]|uniref:hypothetical protein n=1 Tax=Acytostelium subglobosum LB1 TaxID=1410327 RepID=UPI000644A1E7|nr:hypothetical protein SAMD00019534_061910 [Acytostelium subglobosum LB1]GAM23016.1 hypothetical protein SAMD00019534_061910 [Acytostelium subglobosum LB1]|eukprot:XP_012754243.1 hypothetical protein SAMD00019534_061910 [Acytostelium subglobosum LB1]
MDTLPDVVIRLIFIMLDDDEVDIMCLGMSCVRLFKVLKGMPQFSLEKKELSWISDARDRWLRSTTQFEAGQTHTADDKLLRVVDGNSGSGSGIPSLTLPPNITRLRFVTHFNTSLLPGLLPDSITSLTFGGDYNKVIRPHTLPNTLIKIFFGSNFNVMIIPGSLPDTLRTISFGFDYNQAFKQGSLPSGLTSLTFGFNFNQTVCDDQVVYLPSSLTSLHFGACFNQHLTRLPQSLISLGLDGGFSSRVTLPPKVARLNVAFLFQLKLLLKTATSELKDVCVSYFPRNYKEIEAPLKIPLSIKLSTVTSIVRPNEPIARLSERHNIHRVVNEYYKSMIHAIPSYEATFRIMHPYQPELEAYNLHDAFKRIGAPQSPSICKLYLTTSSQPAPNKVSSAKKIINKLFGKNVD